MPYPILLLPSIVKFDLRATKLEEKNVLESYSAGVDIRKVG